MGLLAVAAAVISVLLLFALADQQRSAFGDDSAAMLMNFELGALVAAAIAAHLWQTGRRTLSRAVGCLSAAIVAAYLGWFIHPDQIHARALERMLDYERALVALQTDLAMGIRDSDSSARLQRIARELRARRSEYSAAQIRYSSDADRSTFMSWTVWLVSAALAVVGIRDARKHMTGETGATSR